MNFTWVNGRRLATLTKSGTTASYTYDVDGIRTSKTVNGVTTTYYLNGSQILSQKTGSTRMDFIYDENGAPLGLDYNGTRYYYITNLEGDIVKIINQLGTEVVEYTYDGWGVPTVSGSLASTLGQDNPFRFKGYYYDVESGMYYLQSRYYDPVVGRFINADSLLDNRGVTTLNMFAYCSNNPINNQDPNGHFYFGALIGGIIGGIAGAVTAVMNGKSVKSGLITGAITGAIIGGICDSVATAGLSTIILGVVACGVFAGGGNAVNQWNNYHAERKEQLKNNTPINNSSQISNSPQNSTNNTKMPTSSNGKLASECSSFAEYVDVKSIATSSICAMAFAPLSIGANCIVNSAFVGVNTSGVTGFVAQFGANFAMGGNISILQSIIELV